MRIVAAMLATAAAVLALAATAGAATISVQIKSTGFSPSSISLNHGDQVTWKNTDKVDHQVVADDGSFASPILHAGQSYTTTFNRAGTFRYHDSYAARHTGKITVKGPPPSLTLALSEPIVDYGTVVTLSGAISTGAANQSVEIDATPYGQASPIQLVVLKTGTGGTFSYTVTPVALHHVRRTLEQHRERDGARAGRAEAAAPRRRQRLHEGRADGSDRRWPASTSPCSGSRPSGSG